MNSPTITLALIVRNEARLLKNCLRSASAQVDEIVIVDTGSTDDTQNIAREFTDKIYRFPWQGDFSAARNYALDRASGDWILSLDADEELVCGLFNEGAIQELKNLIRTHPGSEAFLLPLHNPVSNSGEYNRYYVLRLFKNNGKYRFHGQIHEQVSLNEPEVVTIAEEPVIRHALLTAGEQKRKRGRNLVLLKQALVKDPDNPFLRYYLGLEWLMLAQPERALPLLRTAYENLSDDYLLFRAPALRHLLICLHALGRIHEGICLCLEADLSYPEYTDIYYLAGIFFEEGHEYTLAAKWFRQALQGGTPPAVFSHMHGTGGFLARYHLGHCLEMLGRLKDAQHEYEQALAENPNYLYPIYNLFAVKLFESGPRPTFAYFSSFLEFISDRNRHRAINPESSTNLSLAIANLFIISGYPELARSFLTGSSLLREGTAKSLPLELSQSNLNELSQSNLNEWYLSWARSSILSGYPAEGKLRLKQFADSGSLPPDGLRLGALAGLLLGELEQARSFALKLWSDKCTRCEGYILLKLIRLTRNPNLPAHSYPHQICGIKVADQAMDLFQELGNFLPGQPNETNLRYTRLLETLTSFILALPELPLKIYRYYQEKADSTAYLLARKFGYPGEAHAK